MKENWTYKKFEDCLEKVKYTSKISTSDYLAEGKYPIISQEEGLIAGFWNNEADVFRTNKPVVIFGDHTRILKYVDFDFVLGADGVKILQPIDGLFAKFLFYYLQRCDIPSLGYSRHYKLLKEIEIPIPNSETQSRIVAELDLLQSIIDKQKAQLKELDNLAQAIFYDMFGDPVENEKGWEVKKMKDIAMVKIGPFGSLLHTSDYITGGTPLVNPIHMKNGQICTENSFTISDEKKKEMQPYLLKKGDVIFARRGEIGRCAIVSEKEDGYLCGTGSLFVRFTEPISEVFVLYLTKSDSFIKDLVSKAKGATMLNINCKIVEDQQLTLPPLPLQRSFAAKIESIEKQKAAISKSIEETQKLFDYTMDKYFG